MRLKREPELKLLLQLADRKKCFLADLETVPADEIELWIAYYEDVALEQKRDRQRQAIESKLAANAAK